jgi:hypothetical protein
MGIDAASHAYQLRQLANGKFEQTAELSIKEASFRSSKHSLPPGHPGGNAVSDSEKAEALANSLGTSFGQ